MCGITGFVSKRQLTGVLKSMTDTLSHRGPDADGLHHDQNQGVALGHRRLSILDLSSASNQPFTSSCSRYIMVFNGEIYNFKEIAKSHDLSLKTSSDTEVVLELFCKKGPSCIEEFNGMFAIAIWDTKEENLYLFRDRIGIKPLYYCIDEKEIVFASELKAIKKFPLNLEMDMSAISSYLHLGYFPAPHTIFKQCKKFPAGHYAMFKNGNLTFTKYWSVEDKIQNQTKGNEKDAKKELKHLLHKSVERRLISDVALGTFLSGGIDSSLVTSIAQDISSKPINTFSIGFKEGAFNEATYARQISKQLGTNHHELILTEKEAIEKVDQLYQVYDEPLADSSTISTLLVSEMAKRDVTVCLSGDGGDELFMGYGMYDWARRLNNPLISAFRGPLSWGLSKTKNNKYRRGALVLNYEDSKNLKSHLFSQEQNFYTRSEIKKIFKKNQAFELQRENSENNRVLNPMEEQALFDMKYYLPDDLLVKVDRASMNHSLEVRVPILDHTIVEFALNLDSQLKYKNKSKKYLLKQVLYDYLPEKMFDRPKWGFGVPLGKWLKKDLSYLIDKYLNKEIIETQGLFDYQVIQKLIKDFTEGKDYLYYRIWTLILLNKWIKNNS